MLECAYDTGGGGGFQASSHGPRIPGDQRVIFGVKPIIIRGHRLAVEHVLGMLAAGGTPETILNTVLPGWSR